MGKITEYSIGFMFTDDMKQVLLLLKSHGPKCVIGRWNGIGGHIKLPPPHVVEQDNVVGRPGCNCGCRDYGETSLECQIREFEEETGIKTIDEDWFKFTELQGKDFIVHCFWGRSSRAVLNARSMTEEPVEIVNVRNTGSMNIFNIPLAPNLVWFIPFLCDVTTKNHLCVVLANYMQDDKLNADTITTI